ncbi:MAG TPA: response regulator [Firmicutes bacterium]|nr:response regulator [Bacillota bacterium]
MKGRQLTSGARIMVVDDQPGIRALMRAVLRLDGHQVLPAADWQEALQVAREHRPQVIFLDLCMPVMSGWCLLPELRRLLPRAMFCLMSADPLAAETYGPGGGPDWPLLKKPFDIHIVRALAIELLSKHEAAVAEDVAPYWGKR